MCRDMAPHSREGCVAHFMRVFSLKIDLAKGGFLLRRGDLGQRKGVSALRGADLDGWGGLSALRGAAHCGTSPQKSCHANVISPFRSTATVTASPS